jgi:hypothetical protein
LIVFYLCIVKIIYAFFPSIIHKILADFGIAKLDKVFDANISKKAAINIIRVFAPNF